MTTATHDDIIRLFPGVQDHAVLEVLSTEATVDELDVALRLLQGDDEGLIDFQHQKGGRLNLLLEILRKSEIPPRNEFER